MAVQQPIDQYLNILSALVTRNHLIYLIYIIFKTLSIYQFRHVFYSSFTLPTLLKWILILFLLADFSIIRHFCLTHHIIRSFSFKKKLFWSIINYKRDCTSYCNDSVWKEIFSAETPIRLFNDIMGYSCYWCIISWSGLKRCIPASIRLQWTEKFNLKYKVIDYRSVCFKFKSKQK